jgi:hypothetical protein
MTVETLRNLLAMMPPEKEVLIQQGLDYDYATTESVSEKTVMDWDEFAEDDSWNDFVVIDFTKKK